MKLRRSLKRLALPLGLAAGLLPALSGCALPPSLQSVMALAGGTSAKDAFVVASVSQEYEILQALGLKMQSQTLRGINGKNYDVLTTINPATGENREVWFDISRFYGRTL